MSSVALAPKAGSAPGSSSFSAVEWSLRCELAAAYRLAAMQGWHDLIATHLSVRLPGTDHEFLINPYGMLFEEITASSLLRVNQNGDNLTPTKFKVNPAGFVIHSCVHMARPEVGCVIHLHTRDGTGVATQKAGLLPATQHALVIFHEVTYHDFEGPAFDPDEQQRLIADLGDKRIMMLRNHGTLAAGRTVAEAFVLMYRIERACRMQIAAQSGGQELCPLSDEVIAKSIETGKRIFSKGGLTPEGEMEFAALRRKLDREQPDYAT